MYPRFFIFCCDAELFHLLSRWGSRGFCRVATKGRRNLSVSKEVSRDFVTKLFLTLGANSI